MLSGRQLINLVETRELMAQWNEVRVAILAGQIAGFYSGVQTRNGEETVMLAGAHREDPMQAVRSLMKAAAAYEEEPEEASAEPPFRASRM